jgi:hypothetical protein
MVHLTSIPTDKAVNAPLVEGMDKLNIASSNQADLFTTSVYGSKFAAEDLPKHEMPENEMPKEVAYRMIRDDLSLDGNPMLKYPSLNPFPNPFPSLQKLTSCIVWLPLLLHTWFVALYIHSITDFQC